MNYYLAVLKEYAVFDGRIRRKKFWTFTLINFVITLIISTIVPPLSPLYALGVLLPSLGATIRRLHDTGRSGAWVLISLIPIIGLIVVVFLAQDSETGTNQYGPNPKEIANSREDDFTVNGEDQLTANSQTENNSLMEREEKPAQIICSKCGAEVKAENNFCPECGSEMISADKQECTNCKTIVDKEAQFCPKCGEKLN